MATTVVTDAVPLTEQRRSASRLPGDAGKPKPKRRKKAITAKRTQSPPGFIVPKLNPTTASSIDAILARTTAQDLELTESRDPEAIQALLHSGDPFLDAPRKDSTTARQDLKGMRTQPSDVRVRYKAKVHDGHAYGRRYAETEHYPPLQGMKAQVRAALSLGQVDVDMRAAHPTFLCDLLGAQCPASIREYVQNREATLKKCMQATGLSRKKVKPLYNMPLFAGDGWKIKYGEEDIGAKIREPYRTEFKRYVDDNRTVRAMLLDAFPRFRVVARGFAEQRREAAERAEAAAAKPGASESAKRTAVRARLTADKKLKNIDGSALSYLLQTAEDVALEEARLFFAGLTSREGKPEYELKALVFDGLQLLPGFDFTEPQGAERLNRDIEAATAHVRRMFGWEHFALAQKPVECVYLPDSPGSSKARANACILANFRQDFNKRFCVVPFGVTPSVIELNSRNYAFAEAPLAIKSWPYKAFKDQFAPSKYWNWGPKKNKALPYAPVWLNSEDAERCTATTFNPKRGPTFESSHGDRLFNLWRGLQVEPKKGEWANIRGMLLNDLCGGSEENLKYLLDWSALAVQRPWQKCVTALVILGPQGVGKGTYANKLMGSFFGKGLHYAHIVNPEHLVGTFNGLVATSVLIVLDECLFPGNHTHASVLKSLLHDEQKVLRQLFKDAVMVPCYDHVIVLSNDAFAFRMEKDDRSGAGITAKDTHQGEDLYWTTIHREIENGGRQAFLWHLLYERDISDFVPEKMPASLDLAKWNMKIHSLSSTDTFLLKWLKNPELYRAGASETEETEFLVPLSSSDNGARRYGLAIDRKLLWIAFSCSAASTKHNRPESFQSAVLNAFRSGTSSGQASSERALRVDYRHGAQRSRNTHYGVVGDDFDDCIKRLRTAFAGVCRTPVELVFPGTGPEGGADMHY